MLPLLPKYFHFVIGTYRILVSIYFADSAPGSRSEVFKNNLITLSSLLVQLTYPLSTLPSLKMKEISRDNRKV